MCDTFRLAHKWCDGFFVAWDYSDAFYLFLITLQCKFHMWLACRLVSAIISAIFGFQVEKCAQPHSVQSLRFRIPLQILSIFRYRHVLLIPHSALIFQAIPDSAKKKGPIPPFRQPVNPP